MRARSTLKVAGLLMAALTALAIVGLVVAIKSINLNDSIKELLAVQVEAATGRILAISGPLEIRLGLIPRMVASGVSFSNPPGSSRPEMVKIKRLEMGVALLPLLKHEILINHLIVSAPDILIETEGTGPGNLDFSHPAPKIEPKPATTDGSLAYRLDLEEVIIENGVVTWRDRGTDQAKSVEIPKMTVRPDRTSDNLLMVQLLAKAWGREVEIIGTVGRINTVIEGKPWSVHLKTVAGGLAMSADGTIAELTAFRGLNLTLMAQGGELAEMVQLAGITKPDTAPALGPFKLAARLVDGGGSLTLADVEVAAGRRDTLLLNAQGTVKDLAGTAAVDLALTGESDNLAGLSRLAGTELPARGPMRLSGLLRGSGKDWRLSDLKASLAGSDLAGELAVQNDGRLHLSGKLSANTLVLSDFTTSTASPAVSQPVKATGGNGRINSGQPLSLEGLRALDADLTLEVGHLVLDRVQLVDTTVDMRLDAAGKAPAVALLLTGRQVELGSKLTDRGFVTGGKNDPKMDRGVTKPDTAQALGPFKLSARLVAAGGSLALTDVVAAVGRRDTLLLNAQGTVNDLAGTAAVDLALTGESDNLAGLSRLAGTELPAQGPMRLSGLLRGSGKDWRLSDLKASLAGSDLAGELAIQNGGRLHLSGKLSANTLVLSDFTPSTASPGTPAVSQPVKATGGNGRINSGQPLSLEGLRALDADLTLEVGHLVLDRVQLVDTTVDMRLDTAGKAPAVALLLTGRQVELGSKLTDRGFVTGGKNDPKMDRGTTKPDTAQALGPFKLSARLVAAGGSLVLTDVVAAVGRRDTLLLNAQGTVKDLAGTAAADLALTGESDNLAGLSRLAGTELPARGPMRLSGLLRGSGKDWRLSDLKASLAGSDLAGELAIQNGGRLHLSGKLSANTLVLSDFTTPTASPSKPAVSQAVKATGSDGRIFSGQPLSVQGLRALDADLTLQVGQLVLDKVQLGDTTVEMRLSGGRLSLKPFRASLAGGTVEGEASLDATPKAPTVALLLTAHQVELGKLHHRNIITGGKSDLKVDLKGRGDSVRALMATATGETVLSVGEGKIQNKVVNWAAGDLLFQVLGALNPLAKQEDTTSLTCAAARFAIRDGIATADKGIGMRTAKVDVIGSGTVDLRSENLDLGIRPRARQGAGVSLSTPLVGVTRLRGTFAKPSVGIDEEGALRAAASVGVAAATGGMSLLSELVIDKVSADDPCRTALRQTAATQKDQTQKKRGTGDFIQGLFGR